MKFTYKKQYLCEKMLRDPNFAHQNEVQLQNWQKNKEYISILLQGIAQSHDLSISNIEDLSEFVHGQLQSHLQTIFEKIKNYFEQEVKIKWEEF